MSSGSSSVPGQRQGVRRYGGVIVVAGLVGLSAGCGGGRQGAPAPQPAASPSALGARETGAGCTLADTAPAMSAPADADVAIVAHVHAQRVRVDRRENVGVTFPGQGARDTASCVLRSNLPHPLQTGRTYRDVDVKLRIVSRFDSTQPSPQTDTITRRPPATGGLQTPVPGANP